MLEYTLLHYRNIISMKIYNLSKAAVANGFSFKLLCTQGIEFFSHTVSKQYILPYFCHWESFLCKWKSLESSRLLYCYCQKDFGETILIPRRELLELWNLKHFVAYVYTVRRENLNSLISIHALFPYPWATIL